MQSNPEHTQLSTIFTQLTSSLNPPSSSLTPEQFKNYINTQPRKLPDHVINHLFGLLPQGKMDKKDFITYMMGYRLGLQSVALSRFAIEKEIGALASASPSQGGGEIKRNQVKLSVASKKGMEAGTGEGEKHSLAVKVGRDTVQQAKRFAQFKDILGRKPDEIVGLIKFRVDGAQQEISQGLQAIIETAKGMLSQMDQELFRIIDLFRFTVKSHGNFIYIFVQVGHVFLEDSVNFLNEMIQTLSPDAVFELGAQIKSNYLKEFLKQGSQKKMQDLQVSLHLNINSQSLKKLKQVTATKSSFNESEKTLQILLLLFNQVNLSASFSNSQKLFNHLGLGQFFVDSKQRLSFLKQMSIFETLQGFVPGSEKTIQNIKKHAKGEGEISVNLGNAYLRIQFAVQINGFFQLF